MLCFYDMLKLAMCSYGSNFRCLSEEKTRSETESIQMPTAAGQYAVIAFILFAFALNYLLLRSISKIIPNLGESKQEIYLKCQGPPEKVALQFNNKTTCTLVGQYERIVE